MMLKTKDYIWGVLFGLVCGGLAFFITGQKSPAESVLVALVGVGGYLYGQYSREKERRKTISAKKSKKAAKRAQR